VEENDCQKELLDSRKIVQVSFPLFVPLRTAKELPSITYRKYKKSLEGERRECLIRDMVGSMDGTWWVLSCLPHTSGVGY
jgi:hypothetical protein